MAYLYIATALACVLLCNALVTYHRLRRNIALAQSSGLCYVVTPVHVFSVFWLATYWLWLPLLNKLLPASLRGPWFDILDPEWAHKLGHEPFAKIGSDVFLVASPTKLSAFVADADVVTQITSRRNDFPKPLEMYTRLDLYGKNLVSSEGADWRMHRKLTAPSFGERNNELVFTETLHHTQSLLRLWKGMDGSETKVIKDPGSDTMIWALYVISGAGFDVRVTWPHEENLRDADKEEGSQIWGSKAPPGHSMNYREALSELLHNIMWTFMGPPEYLSKSPFKVHRTVAKAMLEWGNYMDEIYTLKKSQLASNQSAHGMDLFRTLIVNSGILDPATQTSPIEKSDLLGNAFVLMLAGHETTANALHFSLLFLAMRWSSQKRLQDEIDRAVNGTPIEDWKYEEVFPKLFNGMPAAVMNETLRVITPINNIPKSTAPGRPQTFTMDGKQYTMPGDTHISLSSAIHMNPRYWPADDNEKETRHNANTDIPDPARFRPERWLAASPSSSSPHQEDTPYDDEALRGPSGTDTSASLFTPTPGAYIPFSSGFRSCIGRRFAQVELLAAFAVLFSQYSVELAVDELAGVSEAEVAAMGEAQKERLWRTEAAKVNEVLRKRMSSVITLQLRGVSVPVRLVRRGEETWKLDM